MVDFHIHSYYSDGTLSPKELVRIGKEKGLEAMAVTDHDGLQGIEEALAAGKEYGVKVIPGIELSCAIPENDLLGRNAPCENEIYMHILGYGISTDYEPLNKAISWIRESRANRNDRMLKALSDLGYELSKEDLQVHPMQEYIGKPNMARALLKKGYTGYFREAFKAEMFLKHPSVKSVHRVKIDGKEAIELIKGAGGKAVLAHPMKTSYKNKNQDGDFFKNLESILIQLKEWGLEGMECYYNATQLITETERLLELAEKLGLIISAGSDYHGPEVSTDFEMGDFPIPPLKSNLQHSIHL